MKRGSAALELAETFGLAQILNVHAYVRLRLCMFGVAACKLLRVPSAPPLPAEWQRHIAGVASFSKA